MRDDLLGRIISFGVQARVEAEVNAVLDKFENAVKDMDDSDTYKVKYIRQIIEECRKAVEE